MPTGSITRGYTAFGDAYAHDNNRARRKRLTEQDLLAMPSDGRKQVRANWREAEDCAYRRTARRDCQQCDCATARCEDAYGCSLQ